MSLQISSINSFTFQYLEQGFLQQLKKQSEARAKPSKAVLDALKHSTSLNKTYKAQLQSLKQQLSSVNQQNDFLKSMIENLKGQVDFLKSSKQDKLKKFYDTQSQLLMKIQLLTNQNSLLHKQIDLLKSRLNSQSQSHISINSPQKDHQFQRKINAFLSNALSNSLKNSGENQDSMVFLHESSKFCEYVNYDSSKKQNFDTQPNSKPKIELQDSRNININAPKSNFAAKNQCEEELTKMLNLKHDSRDFIDDEDSLANAKGQFSSNQELQAPPKITFITSENQLFAEEEEVAETMLQTPTLSKQNSDNVRESNFKVFADDLRQSEPYNKGSQFTFLNLETRKSIEQGKTSLQSMGCSQKGKVSLVKEHENSLICIKQLTEDICLDNISGVDYAGLLEDIRNGHDGIEQTESMEEQERKRYFLDNVSQDDEGGNTVRISRKRTSSELVTPDKSKSATFEVRRKGKQGSEDGRYVKSPVNSPNRQKQSQMVTIAIHSPIKYMTVAESYKTIDLNNSNKNIPSIDPEPKKSPSKRDPDMMKSSSTLLSRSRCSPKAMMSSKLMVINNVRKIQKANSFNRNSLQNDDGDGIRSQEPKSPTSLHPESANGSNDEIDRPCTLIQSTRLKNMMVSKINTIKSINDGLEGVSPSQLGQDQSVTGNYSSFRKRLQEQNMKTSIKPRVSWNNEDGDEEEGQGNDNERMGNEKEMKTEEKE